MAELEGRTTAGRGPLGAMLIDWGAITAAELEQALGEQRRTKERLGIVLMRRGVDGELVARALARQLCLPYASPPLQPEGAAVRMLDAALATRLRAVPLSLTERVLRVAMADPLDMAAVDDLRFRTGRRIDAVVASVAAVDAALIAAYHATAVSAVLTQLPASEPEGDGDAPAAEVGHLRRASESPPIVALVDLLLSKAVQQRGSDLHLEPSARVRVRIDGVLRDLLQLPVQSRGAVISRIKVMAGLDISVKRRPQDGRCAVRVHGQELTLRVSTLPTVQGEKVVLRLLEAANASQRLSQLGMARPLYMRLQRLLSRSHGVLLVTGPTGSGKTSTLYAALSGMDRERRNIVTLEDPVEYRLPGLTQVQVQRQAGLGFAAALRAVLRQDPDVVMVGELRDRETVEIALAAAMTGHLVLSTLHTNDAASAPVRLYEMGAAPYLVAGGVIGVLAQRLARRLCEHCRVQRSARAADLAALGLPPRDVQVFAPLGCDRCEGTGYRGRIGIFELLTMPAAVREAITRRAPVDLVRAAARTDGLVPLGADGWAKVRAGLTSLEEVAPLLLMTEGSGTSCPGCDAPTRARFLICPHCGRMLRRACGCGRALEPAWCWCPACGARHAAGAHAVAAATAAAAGNPQADSGVLVAGARLSRS